MFQRHSFREFSNMKKWESSSKFITFCQTAFLKSQRGMPYWNFYLSLKMILPTSSWRWIFRLVFLPFGLCLTLLLIESIFIFLFGTYFNFKHIVGVWPLIPSSNRIWPGLGDSGQMLSQAEGSWQEATNLSFNLTHTYILWRGPFCVAYKNLILIIYSGLPPRMFLLLFRYCTREYLALFGTHFATRRLGV